MPLFVMLNSAASMLVRDVTVPEGLTDPAYYAAGSNPNGDGDLSNMKAILASLSISSERKATVKGPSVVICNQFPVVELKDKPQETAPKNMATACDDQSRPKRQLPVTPKSLYSAGRPEDTEPQNDKELSTDSEPRRRNQKSKNSAKKELTQLSNRLSASAMSTSSSSSSEFSLPDKPANRQLLYNQTHIAAYKFVARHSDEIDLEAGDPICVSKMHEDLWYEGQNVRTGKRGIFPSRYVSDILRGSHSKDSLSSPHDDQFFLRFLGSVEVSDFKGNEIICDAMRKIVKQHQLTSVSRPPQCTLEVSARGIKIVEHQYQVAGQQQSKRQSKRKLGKLFDKEQKQRDGRNTSHFFSLKNVTFCGCHPTNARFFAFITKHPEEHRFACHVFMSEYSTEPLAFSVGQAFKEFYAEFMDFQAPMEDFYIE